MSKLFLLIFLGAVGFATCQYRGNVERPQPISYDELRQKFVMYRVFPTNNQQVEALKNFCNSNANVSIFSKIQDPGAGIDVLIKYSEMVSIIGLLKRNTGIRQMTVLDKNIKMTFSKLYSPPSRNGYDVSNGPNQMHNSPEFEANSGIVIPSFGRNQAINNPNFGPIQRNNNPSSGPGQTNNNYNFGPNQMDDEDDSSYVFALGENGMHEKNRDKRQIFGLPEVNNIYMIQTWDVDSTNLCAALDEYSSSDSVTIGLYKSCNSSDTSFQWRVLERGSDVAGVILLQNQYSKKCLSVQNWENGPTWEAKAGPLIQETCTSGSSSVQKMKMQSWVVTGKATTLKFINRYSESTWVQRSSNVQGSQALYEGTWIGNNNGGWKFLEIIN